VKSLLLSLALLLQLVGCATGPRGLPPVEGISNFHRVNDDLFRGGQPSHLGLEHLKRVGIKTIINLRMPEDRWVAEEAEARAQGINYTNVPMRGWGRPTDEQVAKALSLIETSPSPVFIHCKRGCDRTGTVIACYRIKHDLWTGRQALSEAGQRGMSKWEFGMKNFVLDFDRLHKDKWPASGIDPRASTPQPSQ
jgi:tyrosine-protein phosphatase SIW14